MTLAYLRNLVIVGNLSQMSKYRDLKTSKSLFYSIPLLQSLYSLSGFMINVIFVNIALLTDL